MLQSFKGAQAAVLLFLRLTIVSCFFGTACLKTGLVPGLLPTQVI